MSARLIDLIADHIRSTYSARTYVEVDEKGRTIRVDGQRIGNITEQTIEVWIGPNETLLLDAREPNFTDRLSRSLYWVLNSHESLYSRQLYREQKERDGIRQMLRMK